MECAELTLQARIEKYFQENNIPFEIVQHNQLSATTDPLKGGKSILLKIITKKREDFILYVIPSFRQIQTKSIRKLLRAKQVLKAGRNELYAITGCDPANLPPIASIFDLQLVMDSELLREPKLYVKGGIGGLLFAIDPTHLARIEKPLII